ncbi:hypothetical protein [Streptomyces sp. NPDC040750]|uniref:hypothetical protein n=1 Tax=Streptomyces sp. NPDC040750 TaxID=3154491 RepID=UPI00340637F8
MRPRDGLSREEQDQLDEVRIACPDIATACALACVFTGLVRDRRGHLLADWVRSGDPVRIAYGCRRPCLGGRGAHEAPAGARPDEDVDQDDDGLAGRAAPHPRAGEPHLVLSPVAQPQPRPHAAHQVAHHERRDGNHQDVRAHRQDHRIPIADSCSIRSGVSVAALLR